MQKIALGILILSCFTRSQGSTTTGTKGRESGLSGEKRGGFAGLGKL